MGDGARAGLALALVLACGGCFGSGPDCGGAEARKKLSGLFLRQLRFTPYINYIDVDDSKMKLEAIFTTDSDARSSTCVAFVSYDATLNARAKTMERRDDLLYSFLYELNSEKQIYYEVKVTDGGKLSVQIDRVGG